MFEVDLYGQVPFYSKENPDWGGPAVCQMAMNGYPPGATSSYIDQTTIWNYIQANNKEGGTGPWGTGWYSDPYAVTKTLNDLCPPTGHWIDVSNTNREIVLYKLLRWMANYMYPSPICLSGHDLWVILIDYMTSDDPRQVTNPTLERIGYNDPRGWYENAPGDLFLSWSDLWGSPCYPPCGQIWQNKYVGIGEPPEQEGSVQVEKISRIGKELITPRDAAVIARKYLSEYCREKSGLILKRLTDVRAQRPMLVRELPLKNAKLSAERGVRFYIVPFFQKYEVDKVGTPLVRLCVRVNAYSGRDEGLTLFTKPVRYLQQKEALGIARRNMRLNRRDISRIEAELVFQPLQMHLASSLPAWRIAVKDQELFITQEGMVLGTLNYRTYRGG